MNLPIGIFEEDIRPIQNQFYFLDVIIEHMVIYKKS